MNHTHTRKYVRKNPPYIPAKNSWFNAIVIKTREGGRNIDIKTRNGPYKCIKYVKVQDTVTLVYGQDKELTAFKFPVAYFRFEKGEKNGQTKM